VAGDTSKKVVSVAAAPTETRNIILAQGIEFNNSDLDADDKIPDGSLATRLKAAGTPLTITSPGRATFRSVKQGVTYNIKVVNKKAEFIAALKSNKTTHVIYDGHSRYGRGACFGTSKAAGEDWEAGHDKDTGLFRMGMPFVGVPLKDVGHHFYSTSLIPSSTKLNSDDCEHDLAASLGSLKAHSLAEIGTIYKAIVAAEKKKPAAKQESLEPDEKKVMSLLKVKGAAPKATDKFWTCILRGEGFSLVLDAGWDKTASAPADLGATDLKCRVFCHFGCTSFQHYHHVVRKLKAWKKDADKDNFAYFTSDLSISITGPNWLFHLLTYDEFSAGLPWEKSLEYARKNANADIKKFVISYNKTHPSDLLNVYQIV
jgi:hypothetical protein